MAEKPQCVRHPEAHVPFVKGLALTQWNNEIISTWTPVQYDSLVSLSTTC